MFPKTKPKRTIKLQIIHCKCKESFGWRCYATTKSTIFMFTHSDIDSKSKFSKIGSEDCFRSLKLYKKLKLKMENFEILRKKCKKLKWEKFKNGKIWKDWIRNKIIFKVSLNEISTYKQNGNFFFGSYIHPKKVNHAIKYTDVIDTNSYFVTNIIHKTLIIFTIIFIEKCKLIRCKRSILLL